MTFFDGTDTSQVYDLKKKVSRLRQNGGSLESYYNTLQGLWREVDFRRPNPMVCEDDILMYNSAVQEDRVYTFLDGLDDRLDSIRADTLRMQPFPTVEQAYAHVRREDQRQTVMLSKENPSSSLALATKGDNSKKQKGKKEDAGCTHCGNPKHTKDSCFKLHGYPEWWADLQSKKRRESGQPTSTRGKELDQSLVPKRESTEAIANNTSAQTDTGNRNWIIDSGATDHMTYDSQDFVETSTSERTLITNANGGKYPVTGAGKVSFSPTFELSNTLLVPSLSSKLISVGQVTEQLNCMALIHPRFCLFQDILTAEIIGRGTKRDGLYYLDDLSTGRANKVSRDGNAMEEIQLRHRRLGHPSFSYMKYLFPELFLQISETSLRCKSCILAKSHRSTYPISTTRCPKPFMLVHSDVWGPAPISLNSGIKWFVTFIDDCTRMTWLYLIKHKHEVAEVFKTFHRMVKTQFSAVLKVLRSDNGGEFVNQDLQEYFRVHGLTHETSCAHTPQQNGIAERKNRHILEIARGLLFEANAPKRYWPDAITTAVYLMNRLPTKILKFKTPLGVLGEHEDLPSTLMLPPRVFGCVAYVHIPRNARTKLDPCAIRCMFLGYAMHQKGYRCYDPSNRRLYTTMDVTFLEHEMFSPRPQQDSPLQGEIIDAESSSLFDFLAMTDSGLSPTRVIEEASTTTRGREEGSTTQGTEEPETTPTRVTEEATTRGTKETTTRGSEIPSTTQQTTNTETAPEIVPTNDLIPENTPEVHSLDPSSTNIDDQSYKLPYRTTRGKPPQRYTPDHGISKGRYPIADFVSSKPLSDFVHQLSTEEIPNSIEEALDNPKFSKAVSEEMEALQRNGT